MLAATGVDAARSSLVLGGASSVTMKQKFEGPVGQVAGGNIINISPVLRPRVIVKTGDGVVDAKQKAELKRLVGEWVDARSRVRKSRSTYGAAWSAFNANFSINSYAELPMERFDEACSWLRRQLAIINGMKSASKVLPDWRPKAISAIKARCKNQLGDPDAYKPYIQTRFGKSSLTELTDDELRKTKVYVMGKKA